MDENTERCKYLAEQLEKYASGNYFLYEDNLYPIDPENDFWENDDNYYYFLDDDGYYYYHINNENVYDGDVSATDIYTYLSKIDIYDIKYTIDEKLNLSSVRVMIGCGGPNEYINTLDNSIELFWWGDKAKYYFDSDISNYINEYFEEELQAKLYNKYNRY